VRRRHSTASTPVTLLLLRRSRHAGGFHVAGVSSLAALERTDTDLRIAPHPFHTHAHNRYSVVNQL